MICNCVCKPKTGITQICWQDGLRYLCGGSCSTCKKTVQKGKRQMRFESGERSVENHMGDFCHFY